MVLSDQQLRQELISYGEVVPLISQRNREQLRARLEVLRTQKSKKVASSPTRTRSTASPSRATASPSRTAASPSRRATASPSRSLATSSPSRTRSSITTNTGGSGRATRSKQTPNLVELSDSDVESTTKNVTRSTRAGQTTPQTQNHSISLRSQGDSLPSTSSSTRSPGKVTDDVEESIARHRREIKQLLDSARSRDRVTDTGSSSTSSRQQNKSNRPTSPTRTRRDSSKSDDEDRKSSSSSSSPRRTTKSAGSFWKRFGSFLKNLVKMLIVSSILLSGLYYIIQHNTSLFSPREGISCSIQNATECADMKPVIDAVRKQLQVRTGEVDCGFREKSALLVPREEIERYLNERGLKFNLGNNERWLALLKYIKEKPVSSILMWNEQDQQTNQTNTVRKLSTRDALRSLTCRARQDISKTLRNLMLVVLGSTGLLTLAWFFQRQSKNHQENERTFKTYFDKAMKLLEDQYEKHIRDPHTQPWLAISHLREKLIPENEQDRLQHIWDRVKNEISKQKSRIRSEFQDIDGKTADAWRWIKSAASSPKKTQPNVNDETDEYTSSDAGLTECLKLRHCFRSEDHVDDGEIDDAVDRIQERCASINRIEHIGIHSVFIYLKFSSKEAAAQGYHLLNNWKYQNRHINVKYVRLNRYHEHFPEAEELNTEN